MCARNRRAGRLLYMENSQLAPITADIYRPCFQSRIWLGQTHSLPSHDSTKARIISELRDCVGQSFSISVRNSSPSIPCVAQLSTSRQAPTSDAITGTPDASASDESYTKAFVWVDRVNKDIPLRKRSGMSLRTPRNRICLSMSSRLLSSSYSARRLPSPTKSTRI